MLHIAQCGGHSYSWAASRGARAEFQFEKSSLNNERRAFKLFARLFSIITEPSTLNHKVLRGKSLWTLKKLNHFEKAFVEKHLKK